MKLTDIDKNFFKKAASDDEIWLDVKNSPFEIYGVKYDKEEKCFVRMPVSVAKQTNKAVEFLNTYTAGGRLLFATDSTKISIKCKFPNIEGVGLMGHMPITGSNGLSLYVNGKFVGVLNPAWDKFISDKDIEFSATFSLAAFEGVKQIKLYFPLYGIVSELYVAVEEDAKIYSPKKYRDEKPIVFYGSSITQGGCASRPGNDYESYIERKFNTDIINLGFSGSGKGEKVIAEHIATLNPSIVVMDYDYNAPDLEFLEKTHYPFYKTIRNHLKDVPIIFITNFHLTRVFAEERRQLIKRNYLRTVEEGDKNTAFISGTELFGQDNVDACTVDGTHPNDLGFYKMAQSIGAVIEKFLK